LNFNFYYGNYIRSNKKRDFGILDMPNIVRNSFLPPKPDTLSPSLLVCIFYFSFYSVFAEVESSERRYLKKLISFYLIMECGRWKRAITIS